MSNYPLYAAGTWRSTSTADWWTALPDMCRCSHKRDRHEHDHRGRLVCHGSIVCGCIEYREHQQVAS